MIWTCRGLLWQFIGPVFSVWWEDWCMLAELGRKILRLNNISKDLNEEVHHSLTDVATTWCWQSWITVLTVYQLTLFNQKVKLWVEKEFVLRFMAVLVFGTMAFFFFFMQFYLSCGKIKIIKICLVFLGDSLTQMQCYSLDSPSCFLCPVNWIKWI